LSPGTPDPLAVPNAVAVFNRAPHLSPYFLDLAALEREEVLGLAVLSFGLRVGVETVAAARLG
jgi:hypothetical protein